MALFSMFFFISLYLQDVLHYSAIKTGVSYLPLAVGIVIAAGLGSQLVTRIGFKPTLIAGLLLITGGLAWLSRVPAPGGSYAADVLGPSLLAGVGFGFAFVSVTIANSRTQSLLHSGVHNASVALTKGFDRAFLVGAGFAIAGAILAFVLISSRDSREHAEAARNERAAAVYVAANPASQPRVST